jgi:uncharacterized membrane protein YoaK (UPF0700 family)
MPQGRPVCISALTGRAPVKAIAKLYSAQKDYLYMKSKQLANVLIKVLGLSVCIHGIPAFVTGFVRGFLSGLASSGAARPQTSSGSSSAYVIGALVELALGITLIVTSRALSELLLKGEDE